MKSRLIVITATALIFAAVVTFYLRKQPKEESALQPFRIAVVTWVNHGPFYLAKAKGFYDKYGVEVEINKIEDIGVQKNALMAGSLDGTISSVDFFATAAAEGVPAKTIMKLGAGDGADAIIARKGIESVEGLRGAEVAVEKGSPSHFFLLVVLDEAGLTSSDLKLRYMTAADAGAAYISGNVDACVTWEPWVSNATSKRESVILATSHNRYGYLVDTFVVRNDVIAARRDDVIGFMRAWFDAIEYWKANPSESNQIMADGLGIPVGDFEAMLSGVRLADYEANLDYFGTPEDPGLYWEVFAKANTVYAREGIIDSPADPKNFTDTSFLRTLYD